QGVEDRLAGFEVRVPRHGEGDQRRTILARAGGEAGRNAGRHQKLIPRCLPTLSTSLSPRPERQSTMASFRPIVGASFITWARPWALSSAGMIPSVLVSSWKASSASLSVIGT